MPQGGGARGAAAGGPGAAWRELVLLTQMFGHENVMVELNCHHDPGDDERNDLLARLAALADVGVVATGNVHFAAPAQARLAQALAAIRARRSLADMDGWLAAAGTAYLRSGQEMAALLRRYPGVLERTAALGRECAFDFRVIAPNLPDGPVPSGHTEESWLRELVARKAPARYGPPGDERVPGAYRQIDRELEVIERLRFPGYFLIVHDIVEFCEDKNILCQGRGSAANSAVCYAIGITNVDPVSHHLLFERFLSEGRDGCWTSIWTSSTAAGKRSSSTSTTPTAGTGPRRSPTSSPTGPWPRCGNGWTRARLHARTIRCLGRPDRAGPGRRRGTAAGRALRPGWCHLPCG